MDLGIRGEEARDLAERLLKVYFKTQDYPYTRHHIESYDQFLSQDLPAIIKSSNPITLLHEQFGTTGQYKYRADIYVGGLAGDQIYIGTPTVSLQDSKEVRLLFPNEARLRNLTYSSTVEADIVIRVTYTLADTDVVGGFSKREVLMDPLADPQNFGFLARYPLFRIPIMLHSRYCLLHGKPQLFLKEAGECQYDQGGYFIVDGSEKVLITHQEAAFNTLYIKEQKSDPQIAYYANIACLNPQSRQVRTIAFGLLRRANTIQVTIPFIRKAIPIFVLFRALGVQADSDILRLIFPDPDAAETKILEPMLHESILEAYPFYDSYSAVQYLKVLTKGFSEEHVIDILYNQLFIHIDNRPRNRATFLAECVRRILRVKAGIDKETDRDDIRNQRCITSGVLCRQLFQGHYINWRKAVKYSFDEEYNYHKSIYSGTNFQSLFISGTMNEMFKLGKLTDGLMRAFKGKWSAGSGSGVGEEKTGVIQALSRLSFLDFMSHCRRVVLDFDTGMKLPSPRRLHTSQYGYFCTSETPGGASIGITKNLSTLTAISTASDPAPFIEWLLTRGEVMRCVDMTPTTLAKAVPVFVNAGIVGYTFRPVALRDALKVLKWTGCLPASASVAFSIRDRRLFVYLDEGRPLRPLIHLGPKGKIPVDALRRAKSWRDLLMGVLPLTVKRGIFSTGFIDPFATEVTAPPLEAYVKRLAADAGVIEYVDPYEMNETFIANYPEHIQPETSHMEIHPSTIVGLLTSMIPYANHNQSPRNQLSCSQSKQGLSVYSSAFPNRYDNQVHVLCYGQAPIVRTLYYDYLADGQIGYGHNLILAMGCFTGYNQDDGILMNADSVERGLFRSTCYRSYEASEEDLAADGAPAFGERKPVTRTRIGNPANIPGWTRLRPGIDYTKLDERGIVRVGELVDETSVLVGRYMQSSSGDMSDASLTAQVWTRGRVEKVSVTVGAGGLTMVKVRVVQERIPELGDKFCLTADHQVLTRERGWIGIAEVRGGEHIMQRGASGECQFVLPTETVSFEHTGEVFTFMNPAGNIRMRVTGDHRVLVRTEDGSEAFLTAADLYASKATYWFVLPGSAAADDNTVISQKIADLRNPVGNGVFCFSVPSEVFLVRCVEVGGKVGQPVWTGNSNRHGQKGTIGMLLRSYDMPRSRSGIPVDMIMNTHALPSRMTVAQLLEMLMGKAAPELGVVGNATLFMNEGNPAAEIAKVLQDLGMHPLGDDLMYDGMSGQMIPAQFFVGNCYTMRLKHMPEDKWNARAEGRREQRTRQPTGGRGAQGGLRIGEMERDAILGHGVVDFTQETYLKRSDGYETYICNGCGTVPIYNERDKVFVCSMCDGPVRYTGSTTEDLELLPPNKRSVVTFSKVQVPYSMVLLNNEMNAYMNMGMRYLTGGAMKKFKGPNEKEITADEARALLEEPLPERQLQDTETPEFLPPPAEETGPSAEDLAALGAMLPEEEMAEPVEAPAAAAPPLLVAATAPALAAPAPANGLPTVTIQAAIPPPAVEETPLEEQDMDSIPYSEGNAVGGGAAPRAPAPPGGVNVQTSTQPVLVVPVNVGQPAPPPPAEIYNSTIPGAPATIAVDTSPAAMQRVGLPAVQQGGRSSRASSTSSVRSRGGGAAAPGQRLSIHKMGGAGPDSYSSSPNVKVTVNKLA
jgi:DNA-directed RNA polymerase II subunit RPB2